MMADQTEMPKLVGGFIRWVQGNPNYSALWRRMSASGAVYSAEDFTNDLWLAWMESEGVPETGDFMSDCKARGLTRVLGQVHYQIIGRHRQLKNTGTDDAGESPTRQPITPTRQPITSIDRLLKDGNGEETTLAEQLGEGSRERLLRERLARERQEYRNRWANPNDRDVNPLSRRALFRSLVSMKPDDGLDEIKFGDQTLPPIELDNQLESITHVAVSRRNWWRLMNL